METIIFKIILCSSLLIAIYYLFLQKEKMFWFNRFFLLFAVIFSYTIPFVKINLPVISQHSDQLILEEVSTQQLIQKTSQVSDFDWMKLLLVGYIFITIILIIKSLISIRKIITLKGIDFNYENQKVKLIEKDLPPFSFWNKIYLSKKHFEVQIDNRIFLHEKTHLKQKHSLDLILIEILKTISWFNPAIYFYKKAITDNHEFLADEVIVQKQFNIKDYQNLILTEVLNVQKLSLVNQFNFNNTKKRFIMMTTKKSKFLTIKKLFAVSVIVGSSILFVQKVYASETKHEIKAETPKFRAIETVKMDTIPSKIASKDNVKIKAKKKAPAPPAPKEMKDNELPIPPPPPPAKNLTNAEFPEGINALRMSFANVFDSNFGTNTKEKGTLKTKVYLKIDENGKTTDIKAEGDNQKFNEESVRAMKLATENKTWKPATEEGKPAATVFQLPITMIFQ